MGAPAVAAAVAAHASADASPRSLRRLALAALASVDRSGAAVLTAGCVSAACRLLADAPKHVHLSGTSVLELFLLVAFKRIEARTGASTNFETAMAEYGQLQLTHGAACAPFARAAALRAYEALHAAQLIGWAPHAGGGRGAGRPLREYRPAQLLVSEDELRDGLRGNARAPALLVQWFDREAVGQQRGIVESGERAFAEAMAH